MRLLFISNLFPDSQLPWRGLDNVTLLHAMRAARPEAEIRVLCLRPHHGFWFGKPCELKPRAGDEVFQPSYHWAPYFPKFGGMNDRLFALGVSRALRSLQGWQPQALLVPWLFPDGCGVHQVAAWRGLPMVSVAQGSDVHQYLEMPMRCRAILDLAKRAHLITRSEDLRRRLLRAGAPADHVETVYNGVDLDTFRPGDKTQARRELALPEEGRLLLFVGNFLPVKGLDLLIRSVGLASRHLPERLRLVMIGSGPLQADLASLATEVGLAEDQVIWAGRRPPAEVARFMRASDTVCLSSHNEGVPNVLLEALASGRPLISTRVGGIAEIIDPVPGSGILLPDRDPSSYAKALQNVLQDLPDPDQLHQHATAFAWSRCAARYWENIFVST